jgi:hypothetical protein
MPLFRLAAGEALRVVTRVGVEPEGFGKADIHLLEATISDGINSLNKSWRQQGIKDVLIFL